MTVPTWRSCADPRPGDEGGVVRAPTILSVERSGRSHHGPEPVRRVSPLTLSRALLPGAPSNAECDPVSCVMGTDRLARYRN